MGIDEVKKQIIEGAESQAQALLHNAEAEAKRISSDAEQEVKHYEKEVNANAERLVAAAERKELAAAEFEGKRKLLDKKKEIVEKVMDAAKKELQAMSAQEKKWIIGNLLALAKQEIAVKRVYANKKDISLISGGSINEGSLEVREKDILGGIIAETSDGRISVDLSFETLLEDIKAESLQELSEVLFS